MLYLEFRMAHQSFALATDVIVEVLPALRPLRVPGTPPELLGVINYHGTPVPVLDLGRLAFGKFAQQTLRTRIVLVSYPVQGVGSRLLGLLLEYVGDLVRRDESQFQPGPVPSAAPFAGPVTPGHHGELIQRVELRQLVPEDLWEQLVAPPDAGVDHAAD